VGRTADGARAVDEEIQNDLIHTITLSEGPGQNQTQENIKYGETVSFTVTPGTWKITVTAFLGEEIFAKGSETVVIKPGRNGNISIAMTITDIGKNTFKVKTSDEWASALEKIKIGGNGKEYNILIANNINVDGSYASTFGDVTGITVNIESEKNQNNSITLKSQGNLLNIGNNQSVIIENIALIGYANNNTSLVVINGGDFTMQGKSSIRDNKYYIEDSSGGGVFVNGGNFIMSGGEISNNYAGYGGGVYVDSGSGRFTMSDGKIYKNEAYKNGGGVYVNQGIFTMIGGEIYGNNVITEFGYGGGVYVDNTASFLMAGGTIYGKKYTLPDYNNIVEEGEGAAIYPSITDLYNNAHILNNDGQRAGDLPITDYTIKVENGVLLTIFYVYKADDWEGIIDTFGFISANCSDFIFNIMNDIVINATISPSGGTFGTSQNITVTIRGNYNITLRNETNGSLLIIGTKQTVILQDIALVGKGNNSSTSNNAPLVDVLGGILNMNGNASISGNYYNGTSEAKGGVSITGDGSYLYMNDNASIFDNTAAGNDASFGGGVYIDKGSFTMNGNASIKNNKASGGAGMGGGVYFSGDNEKLATFAMLSGKISGNTAGIGNDGTGIGGGVFVNKGTFTMSGGEISNNTALGATRKGGGVYTTATFNMTGGEIFGNKAENFPGSTLAQDGGGIYVDYVDSSSISKFLISGGTVYGANEGANSNSASSNSAALFKHNNGIAQRGTFNASGFTSYDALQTTSETIRIRNGYPY